MLVGTASNRYATATIEWVGDSNPSGRANAEKALATRAFSFGRSLRESCVNSDDLVSNQERYARQFDLVPVLALLVS